MSSATETRMDKNTMSKYYYYRLESESSRPSEDDSESVYSMQGVETELVKDTSDTDTKSDTEYEVEIEYEAVSSSGGHSSSSGAEEMVLAAAAAAAICDTSLENWITDCEDSDNSSLDNTSFVGGYWTCIQCKSENNNPLFRYCQKCFQDRKTFFPPRPRRNRKLGRKDIKQNCIAPVELDTLRNCLSGLSQDSGIGSSQECPALGLEQIVVPIHLSPGTSSSLTENKNVDKVTTTRTTNSRNYSQISVVNYISLSDAEESSRNKRKRQISESSLSEAEVIIKKPKRTADQRQSNVYKDSIKTIDDQLIKENKINDVDSVSASKIDALSNQTDSGKNDNGSFTLPEHKELCITCNTTPKNSIFLHGSIGHMCCCYKCAMRTWKSIKRCPMCNRKVSNVVKVYTND